MQNILKKNQVFYRKAMELLVILASLWICLSLVLKPCASVQVVVAQEQSTPELASSEIHFSQPTLLPRKLRILEQVKGSAGQGSIPYDEQKRDTSEKPYKQKQQDVMVAGGARGTWREWVERPDTSEFFTMDYARVSRRRPIHNKSLPVGP